MHNSRLPIRQNSDISARTRPHLLVSMAGPSNHQNGQERGSEDHQATTLRGRSAIALQARLSCPIVHWLCIGNQCVSFTCLWPCAMVRNREFPCNSATVCYTCVNQSANWRVHRPAQSDKSSGTGKYHRVPRGKINDEFRGKSGWELRGVGIKKLYET